MVEQEAQRDQRELASLKREHEILRARYEQLSRERADFRKEAETLHQAEIHDLKARVDLLTAQLHDPALTEESRKLRRSNTELSQRVGRGVCLNFLGVMTLKKFTHVSTFDCADIYSFMQ
jgi:predicted RNase H-like nuclease (RuvC/YqgF family)